MYYHCSRQVDYRCKEPFGREEDIVEGLIEHCNNLIPDVSQLEPGLQSAIGKFTKILKSTNGTYDERLVVGSYIKYVVRDGSNFEKTRLVRNLNVKLALHDRTVVII